jgi:hypothetical protein
MSSLTQSSRSPILTMSFLESCCSDERSAFARTASAGLVIPFRCPSRVLLRLIRAMHDGFNSPTRLRDRLLCFRNSHEQAAQPFHWESTRQNLNRLMGHPDDEVGQRRTVWAAGNTPPNSPGEAR